MYCLKQTLNDFEYLCQQQDSNQLALVPKRLLTRLSSGDFVFVQHLLPNAWKILCLHWRYINNVLCGLRFVTNFILFRKLKLRATKILRVEYDWFRIILTSHLVAPTLLTLRLQTVRTRIPTHYGINPGSSTSVRTWMLCSQSLRFGCGIDLFLLVSSSFVGTSQLEWLSICCYGNGTAVAWTCMMSKNVLCFRRESKSWHQTCCSRP